MFRYYASVKNLTLVLTPPIHNDGSALPIGELFGRQVTELRRCNRHTFASLLVMVCVDIRAVAHLVGSRYNTDDDAFLL